MTDVESATITSPGPAPTSVAILSPMRCDSVIQPAVFQLRISPAPHSCFDDLPGAVDRALRQHAERIAVEIDDAFAIDAIERKQLAQRRQRIARVALQAVVPA